MRRDVTRMISECSICQKLKYQREPNWEDAVDHHLYGGLDPLISLSVETLGPLKEDELGNQLIIVIVDNFSKIVRLYPTRNTTFKEFVYALLQWVSIFGVPKMEVLSLLASFHLTYVPYRVITI